MVILISVKKLKYLREKRKYKNPQLQLKPLNLYCYLSYYLSKLFSMLQHNLIWQIFIIVKKFDLQTNKQRLPFQIIIIIQQILSNSSSLFLENILAFNMNILYHHFVQKTKQEQIQRYNTKHRDYLIRCGKIEPNQRPIGAVAINNKRTNNQNIRNNQQKQFINSYNPEYQVQSIQKQQKKRNRRQREFQRPNNSSGNTQTNPRRQQADKHIQDKNNQYHSIQQYQYSQPLQVNPQKQRSIKPLQMNYDELAKKFQNEHKNQFVQSEFKNESQKQYNNDMNQQDAPISIKYKDNNSFAQKEQRPAISNNIAQLPEQENQQVELIECPMQCGRKFNPKVLQKHAKICQKVFQEKRKPFQVKKTDQQAQLCKKKSQKQGNDAKKQNNWKKKRESFLYNMKRARGQQVAPIQDDRIECPGCGRKFNENAASKHIELCKKKNKIIKK